MMTHQNIWLEVIDHVRFFDSRLALGQAVGRLPWGAAFRASRFQAGCFGHTFSAVRVAAGQGDGVAKNSSTGWAAERIWAGLAGQVEQELIFSVFKKGIES